MKTLKRFLAGLGIFLVLVLAGAYLISPEIHVERSIAIDAPVERVFPLVNDFREWESWSPWARADPTQVTSVGDPPAGTGAVMAWEGEQSGKGSQTITLSEPPDRILTSLDFGEQGGGTSTWTFTESNGRTTATWAFDTNMGNSPIARYMGLVMKPMVGRDFESGLAELKALAEAGAAGPRSSE